MKNLFSERKNICILAVIFLVIGISGFRIMESKQINPKISYISTVINETKPAQTERFVHVKGAVRNPGLYNLDSNANVNDAINAAGGPIEDANLNAINLAAGLISGEEIYIPKIGEELSEISSEDGRVNVNTASEDELRRIPGVGEVLAKRIIEYRETYGKFNNVHELVNIRGIGLNSAEDMFPHVVVR